MVAAPLTSRRVSILSAAFQQDATLLGTVRRWWCQTASDRRKPPLLDICLDEVEPGLAKVDVNSGRAVGTDSREEILCLEPVDYLFQFLAIPGEKDGTSSGSVADADDIPLDEWGAVRSCVEGLVVPSCTF